MSAKERDRRMKSDRLFGIVYLLLANGQMSARELAEHFEVSRRTIYRDIDSLSAMNVPLYMNKGRNGGGTLEFCEKSHSYLPEGTAIIKQPGALRRSGDGAAGHQIGGKDEGIIRNQRMCSVL